MGKKLFVVVLTVFTLLFTATPAFAQGNTEIKVEYNASFDQIEKEIRAWLNEQPYSFNIDAILDQLREYIDVEEAQQPEVQTPAPQEEPAPEQVEAPTHPEQVEAPAAPEAPAVEAPEETEAQAEIGTYEQQVVELVNEERTKRGLEPLVMHERLSQLAERKSQDMADNNYFSHTSPTYGSPFEMMNQFNFDYRTAGENIAAGQRTPQEVVQAWMNSAGHRANILNENFTHIGVGYVEGGSYGTYWTQLFMTPAQ